MGRTYLNWAILAAAALALVYALRPAPAGSPEERAALEEGRVIITYWDRHTGHEHEARNELWDEYNRTQGVEDGVFVRSVPIGYFASMEKYLTSISGGAPPDLCSIDSTIMVQLAVNGCFFDLRDWMAENPQFARDAIFPHIWRMVTENGHIWGAPATTDVYALLWNKRAFREAGLDPERPPQTTEELIEYASKLTIRDASGNIEQLGFLPWLPWDLTFMWGGLFGGQWFDDATGRVVCGDDPAIIAMFAWQRDFTKDPTRDEQRPYAVDPNRYMTYAQMGGAYASATNPFYSGKVAMITEGEWQSTFIPKYAPELDWGVAPLPQPEGVEPRGYSPSAHVDVVPSTARHRDEALKVLRWFHTPRGPENRSPVSDYCYAIHNVPTRIDEAHQERFYGDPKFKVFIDQAVREHVICAPVSPMSQLFLDEIDRLREFVIRRAMTPEEAAMALETVVNSEIEKFERVYGASEESAS